MEILLDILDFHRRPEVQGPLGWHLGQWRESGESFERWSDLALSSVLYYTSGRLEPQKSECSNCWVNTLVQAVSYM